MKKILFIVGLAAAMVGCGKEGGASDATRERTRPGAIQSEPAGGSPTEKVRPGVEFPGEYPGGTNVQRNPNSNAASANPGHQQPFGTARANAGAYERTNNLER
jgi:hypothetical protein